MKDKDTALKIYSKSFAEVLCDIYAASSNRDMLAVMRIVACGIKEWHQQGQSIPELSNEHLMIHYRDESDFISVNIEPALRQSCSPEVLSTVQKAKQLARVDLPDDYWKIFKHMYFDDDVVPEDFSSIADKARDEYRKCFPERILREKEIWLWDEKSAQAMVVLHSKSKRRLRKVSDMLKIGFRVLSTLPKIFVQYKKLLRQAYKHPVIVQNRIGVALHPAYWQEEKSLLQELQNIPVLIRFYSHEEESRWQESIRLIKELDSRNIKVSVAMVQDRKAVTNLARWKFFLFFVIPEIHQYVDWIEIGHAINRVKWGIWTADEYAQLMQVADDLVQQYPKTQLVGPAVIDFEWYRMIDALKALPKKLKLYATSQHLYVDRRGAPENFQGKFSTLEKCALGKTIAQASNNCDNRFIISEFNWPLKDTGIYSPIGSPYMAPEWFQERPGVTEEEYANYLIRFLAISICSGFVEQAIVWRLSARGYGLVDDKDNFRKRPAFYALKTFLKVLGHATFTLRVKTSATSYVLLFNTNKEDILLAWTTEKSVKITLPWEAAEVRDCFGIQICSVASEVDISEHPIYCIRNIV